MSTKFSIATMSIAAMLVLTNSAIATAAEAYKTSKGEVVVTGLTPTKRYQIRYINAQDKSGSRQDKSVNSCGEIVVDKADRYKVLIVGSENIDPASLETKPHERCKPKPNTTLRKMEPKGVEPARIPGSN
ncbi:hypothetical protein [Chamaesiphon minutus]|uniref:Uncharacterized protein n=1 Tax=Chamaesiphon minutus (strain ATCC 27169 / PCC 6605) TaxID=1173020 RepID=K9UAN3_CHAP6|nr:hypothetical protein [Chamaesiphon minutus]AFY91688.1 hypothetical protein Cha6605_0391 [Chamaesiphon minutus PCC 6605]